MLKCDCCKKPSEYLKRTNLMIQPAQMMCPECHMIFDVSDDEYPIRYVSPQFRIDPMEAEYLRNVHGVRI